MSQEDRDREELRRAKMEWLRTELHRGLQSGEATPLDMEEVKAEGRRLRAKHRASSGGPD